MEDKCEKYVFFRTVEQRTPNVFWCPRNNAMCDRSEWFAWCPVCDLWCLMFDQMFDHVEIVFVSLLSSIDFNVTTISCPMLRPLSCLTMFCDHNFSLVCRFNLQFSQNYINIDTDEIQHRFCYFVQSLWNKNTIYERSNVRTFYLIFIPYRNIFFFLFHIVLYAIM